MNVEGERILIFGDSLSHPGQDGAPYTFSVDPSWGSNRPSSSPGDLVASMLLEQGAAAVNIDARVGRNAINFWGREDTNTLLATDAAFAPTKVIVMLGTNDIGVDPTQEIAAFTQIRDTYRDMGAEVWAVGPFTYVGNASNLNNGAQDVLNMMAGVFGADKTIDGRPLSVNVQRTGDGVHFTPASAAPTAANITNAILSQNPLSVGSLLGWALLGLGGIVALAWGAKKFDSWREGTSLHGAELEGEDELEEPEFFEDVIDVEPNFEVANPDDYFEKLTAKARQREATMKKALEKHQALIATDASGRRTLLIKSGEMSNPDEGSFRVTSYFEDGPVGHITRDSIDKLATDLASDIHPTKIEPATEAEVITWMSTPEFEEGTQRVLEVQRWNSGIRD